MTMLRVNTNVIRTLLLIAPLLDARDEQEVESNLSRYKLI